MQNPPDLIRKEFVNIFLSKELTTQIFLHIARVLFCREQLLETVTIAERRGILRDSRVS